MATLSRPPGLPPILEGFLNLRGTATPVLRLDRLFGVDRWSPGLYTPLIILRGRPGRLALLAERVDTLVTVGDEALQPLPADSCWNHCAEAEVWLDARSGAVHLVSAERLFLAQERCRYEELRAAEQQQIEQLEAAS